jgi:ribose transport system permease protein
LVAVFTIISPEFLSLSNWLNTSVYTTTTLLLALGETVVIITGGIDLSVGATLGVSSSLAALYLASAGPGDGSVVVAGIIAVATGVAMGLLNSFVISWLGVTPFITTLGTLGIGTGLTLLLTGGTDITIPSAIIPLGNGVWVTWIPVPVAITAVLCVLTFYILRFTRFGLRTYAIGSSSQAAVRSGINVTKHLRGVYVMSGVLAGIAGLLTLARYDVGSPTAGQDAELGAIAAVVIGGGSLFGGEGGVGGTVIGAIFVSSLVTGLVLAGVNPNWQEISVGLLIIGAVAIQQLVEGPRWEELRKRLRRRFGRRRAADN